MTTTVSAIFFKKILEQSAFEVDLAYDGLAGWHAILDKPYDLIITDQCMPKLLGLELIKRMRSAHINLPAILISAMLPTEELEKHSELKFISTLEKPCSLNQLLKTVKAALHLDTHTPSTRNGIHSKHMPATAKLSSNLSYNY